MRKNILRMTKHVYILMINYIKYLLFLANNQLFTVLPEQYPTIFRFHSVTLIMLTILLILYSFEITLNKCSIRANHDENIPSSIKSLRDNSETCKNEFNLMIQAEFYIINTSEKTIFYITVPKFDKRQTDLFHLQDCWSWTEGIEREKISSSHRVLYACRILGIDICVTVRPWGKIIMFLNEQKDMLIFRMIDSVLEKNVIYASMYKRNIKWLFGDILALIFHR